MDNLKDTPALLPWAKLPKLYEGCVMVRGDDLRSGDTIYFTPSAYGRELFVKQSATRWSAMVLKPGNHFQGEAAINLATWYVTRRANVTQAVEGITRLRVDGDDLAAGDLVELGSGWKPYRAEILTIGETEYDSRGSRRAGTIRLDGGEEKEHIFSSFGLALFTVVGGPKIQRANANPDLVQQIATGVIWRGG